MKPVYFTFKGQPPESFDFQKDAYNSFEQIAFAQITMKEWDKLKNGDKIILDEDMERKIREWGGRIWQGGSITTVEQAGSLTHLKVDTDLRRDIEGRYLVYKVENREY